VSKLILLAVIVIFGGLFSLGGLRILWRGLWRLYVSPQRRAGRIVLRREAFAGLLIALAGIAVALLAIRIAL
jgi:hypothetical protein